jgi:hypothetical protein
MSFASVARDIGNPRLAKVLTDLASNVKSEVRSAEFRHKRADIRADMKKLKDQTKRFEIAWKRACEHMLYFPSFFWLGSGRAWCLTTVLGRFICRTKQRAVYHSFV